MTNQLMSSHCTKWIAVVVPYPAPYMHPVNPSALTVKPHYQALYRRFCLVSVCTSVPLDERSNVVSGFLVALYQSIGRKA